MPYRTNLIYRYDGSYQGFLCCVFECFRAKELPVNISSVEEEQQSLFGYKEITTRMDLAQRVERSIPGKISPPSSKTGAGGIPHLSAGPGNGVAAFFIDGV